MAAFSSVLPQLYLDPAPCSSAALPVEIWRHIFQYVAALHDCSEPNQELEHLIQFPFNVAGVCTLWRDILADFAEYWTDLYVLVDNVAPTSLAELKHYVEFSLDLPLKVNVSRSEKLGHRVVDGTTDGIEIERTQAVVEILRPHFKRCTSIQFNVLHNESLPLLDELLPLSSDLEVLCLESFYKNTTSETTSGRNDKAYQSTEVSPGILAFSGRAALDAVTHPYLFYPSRQDRSVTIADYWSLRTSDMAGGRFFNAFASKFGTLYSLNLENIDIPFDHQLASLFTLSVVHLTLNGLSTDTLHFLFRADLSSVRSIVIKNCTLPEDLPSLRLPRGDRMRLCHVDGKLGAVLAEWDGAVLKFEDCDELTTFYIQAITARFESGKYDDLRYIHVKDCQQFSPRALLDLAVVVGRTVANSRIVVNGRAPKLGEEDSTLLETVSGVLRWNATS